MEMNLELSFTAGSGNNDQSMVIPVANSSCFSSVRLSRSSVVIFDYSTASVPLGEAASSAYNYPEVTVLETRASPDSLKSSRAFCQSPMYSSAFSVVVEISFPASPTGAR